MHCGNLFGVGWNLHGQVGVHHATQKLMEPGVVRSFLSKDVLQVDAGEHHTVVLLRSGEVWSWGHGYRGAHGHGGYEDVLEPTRLPITDATSISCGAVHTAATHNDKSVWVWGDGFYGRLGVGNQHGILTRGCPIPITTDCGLRDAMGLPLRVACGGCHTVVVTDAGEVYCTGQNKYFQCAQPDPQDILRFTAVEFFKPDPSIPNQQLQVAAGNQHTALLRAGKVYVWGNNHSNQTPGKSTGKEHMPRLVSVAMRNQVPKTVFCGTDCTAILSDAGSVFYAGKAHKGFGLHTNPTAFIQIRTPEPIVSVGLGWEARSLVGQSGKVYVEGCRNHGAMGVGEISQQEQEEEDSQASLVDGIHTMSGAVCTTCYKKFFLTVPSLTGVQLVAAGAYHTLYVVRDTMHRVFALCYRGDGAGVECVLGNSPGLDIAQGNACDPLHNTPLHITAQRSPFHESHVMAAIARALLEYSPSLLALKNSRGEQFVHVCARTGFVEGLVVAARFVGDEDWLNVPDHEGNCPLHIAVSAGHLPTVAHLLAQTPPPSLVATNALGQTPLHVAVVHGHLDAATALVGVPKCFPSLFMRDQDSMRPTQYCSRDQALPLRTLAKRVEVVVVFTPEAAATAHDISRLLQDNHVVCAHCRATASVGDEGDGGEEPEANAIVAPFLPPAVADYAVPPVTVVVVTEALTRSPAHVAAVGALGGSGSVVVGAWGADGAVSEIPPSLEHVLFTNQVGSVVSAFDRKQFSAGVLVHLDKHERIARMQAEGEGDDAGEPLFDELDQRRDDDVGDGFEVDVSGERTVFVCGPTDPDVAKQVVDFLSAALRHDEQVTRAVLGQPDLTSAEANLLCKCSAFVWVLSEASIADKRARQQLQLAEGRKRRIVVVRVLPDDGRLVLPHGLSYSLATVPVLDYCRWDATAFLRPVRDAVLLAIELGRTRARLALMDAAARSEGVEYSRLTQLDVDLATVFSRYDEDGGAGGGGAGAGGGGGGGGGDAGEEDGVSWGRKQNVAWFGGERRLAWAGQAAGDESVAFAISAAPVQSVCLTTSSEPSTVCVGLDPSNRATNGALAFSFEVDPVIDRSLQHGEAPITHPPSSFANSYALAMNVHPKTGVVSVAINGECVREFHAVADEPLYAHVRLRGKGDAVHAVHMVRRVEQCEEGGVDQESLAVPEDEGNEDEKDEPVDWRAARAQDIVSCMQARDMARLEELVKATQGLDSLGSPTATMLMRAVQLGDPEVVRCVGKHGDGDLDRPSPSSGLTALMLASTKGPESCVQALLDAGASVHARRAEDGFTALHLACEAGNVGCARVLVLGGADCDAEATDGARSTPRALANRNGHWLVEPALDEALDERHAVKGVSLLWLLDFAIAHKVSGWNKFERTPEPTRSVVQRVIMPATASFAASMVEGGLVPSDHCKRATHFVSHAWQCPFWSIVQALIVHQLGVDMGHTIFDSCGTLDSLTSTVRDKFPHGKENYYWIDLFCKNQHASGSEYRDKTMVELRRSIETPKSTVLVLHPLVDPLCLSRCWCLFEVLNSVQLGANIELAPSFPAMLALDDVVMQSRHDKLAIAPKLIAHRNAVSHVDIRTAKSQEEADRRMIMTNIEMSVGFVFVNAQVREALLRAVQGLQEASLREWFRKGFFKEVHMQKLRQQGCLSWW